MATALLMVVLKLSLPRTRRDAKIRCAVVYETYANVFDSLLSVFLSPKDVGSVYGVQPRAGGRLLGPCR
jgi:hypothetical protein